MSRATHVVVFACLLLVLLPGYPTAIVLGRVVDVNRGISLVLLLLLSTYFILLRRQSVYVMLLGLLFVCAALLGLANGADLSFTANHAFAFAPFIIAFLLLELRIGVQFSTALFWITLSAAWGAVTANVIHVFRPELLQVLLPDENVGSVISLGRVGWAGYIVTLPIVAQLGFLDVHSPSRRRLMVAAIPVVIAGAILTFNRTLAVALILLLAYLFYTNWRRMGLKGIAVLATIVAAVSYGAAWWIAANPIVGQVARNRIFALAGGKSEISTDIWVRQLLYDQYWERLRSSYLLGKGVGIPVSTVFGDAAWADVTLITFAIPFGIFGVGVFLLFLWRLYWRIAAMDERRTRRLFLAVFALGLAISLNDDIWSHKFFVVYLVFLVNSFLVTAAARAGDPSVPVAAQPDPA